ncbi:sec-independent translocase [Aestuariimicrobium ganziense]|uniref:sec-independent translocase n=1 Tax=Aestuariimicrobium ganziense TaxID=2773677 RepID=UPI0019415D9F|nr:sec-independent translocase [Aestuariimicrobium ganziense]
MFDVGAPEFIVLVVLAIIFFGPEKIPEMARKGAKIVHFLRGVANQATSQLKDELGPEYAHLTAADLNPKTFIQKHLFDDLQEELKEIKDDLAEIKGDLEADAADLKSIGSEIDADLAADGATATVAAAATPTRKVPFDDEAT